MSLAVDDLSSELKDIFDGATATETLGPDVADLIVTAFLDWVKSVEISLSGNALGEGAPPPTMTAAGQTLNPDSAIVDAGYASLHEALVTDFDASSTEWPSFSDTLAAFMATLTLWANDTGWSVADAIVTSGTFSFTDAHTSDPPPADTTVAGLNHANAFYDGVIGSSVSSVLGGVIEGFDTVGAPVGSSIS